MRQWIRQQYQTWCKKLGSERDVQKALKQITESDCRVRFRYCGRRIHLRISIGGCFSLDLDEFYTREFLEIAVVGDDRRICQQSDFCDVRVHHQTAFDFTFSDICRQVPVIPQWRYCQDHEPALFSFWGNLIFWDRLPLLTNSPLLILIKNSYFE